MLKLKEVGSWDRRGYWESSSGTWGPPVPALILHTSKLGWGSQAPSCFQGHSVQVETGILHAADLHEVVARVSGVTGLE